MKRRDFVRTLTAAGTSLLLPHSLTYAQDTPHMRPQPDPEVRRVHVMFKCHFDAGFIDTQANVFHRYFSEYFPRAIQVAQAANAAGKRRYVWTTGSWLLYEYLEQASPADRKTMEAAIARGDIAWHALPFTWQSEMLTPSLIEGSLSLSQSLDQRFGRKTTGCKMTDVPGHTRGLIAPLAKHGVTFLEIGVNGGSTVAKLPPIFLWKAPSGASLPVMYHWDYSGEARVPGSDIVLVTCVRNDNSGPHTADEIAEIHRDLAYHYPHAEIIAGSLSDMADALAPHRDALPVITAEIADTWIYGCPSDPLKVARYRAVARLREQWIGAGKFALGDSTDTALLRHLLLEPEHTWGTDTKTWLDFDNYKPADLARMLDTKNYKTVQFSWNEKRQDLLDAIATLPAPLRAEAEQAIAELHPTEPKSASGPESASGPASPSAASVETPHYLLAFDPATGAITRLRSKATGREWATPEHPVALLAYQTLSHDDYVRFIAAYLTTTADWAFKDFGKPNIERFGAVSRTWLPTSAIVRVSETPEAHRVLIQPAFDDRQAFSSGLASFPPKLYIELTLPKAQPEIAIDLTWFGKPATRLPEALWLTFNPAVADPHNWSMDKTGEPVSPFDVVASGNRHMHAVQAGFTYTEGPHKFSVEPLDAPVIALGERTPLLFSNDQPDLAKGIHSCLYNNAWGTNYIMWYGEDARFRYRLRA